MGENVCGGKLILLALRRLAGIRGEGGDVDQPGNAVICPRRCDNGSAVRVADENGRAADPPQRALHCRDVACECVEAVLGSDHLVSLRPKGGDHLAEGRAVGPDPVDEHDARLGFHGAPESQTARHTGSLQ